jgi:hypothetical protein
MRYWQRVMADNKDQFYPYVGETLPLALEQAERAVIKMRKLYQYDFTAQYQKTKETVKQVTQAEIGLKVKIEPDHIILDIPMIITKDKIKTHYMQETINQGLKPYFNEPMMLKEQVIVFTYYYPLNQGRSTRYQDYDNIETRAILNALNNYILFDDGPANIEVYFRSRCGDEKRTQIDVISQNKFMDWLCEERGEEDVKAVLSEDHAGNRCI